MTDHKRRRGTRLGVRVPAGLKHAWARRKLVLFLGAGVSQPYGVPGWNDLVITLLLDESSQVFGEFWPHYRVPLGSWLADTFSLSPVSMARLARVYAKKNNFDDDRFRRYVRDQLYRFHRQPPEPTTLSAVADLLARSEQHKDGWHVPAVVTFNFDDLLERTLVARRVRCSPVYADVRQKENVLPVLHVHGYLPSTTPIPEADLVFTEDEYHRVSFSPFHWSQTELVSLLRNYTVLFVGLSMSDPNLRRLLDASHSPNSGTNHYLLRTEYTLTPEDRTRAYATIVERARLQAQKLGIEGADKSAPALEQAVNQMLQQAREYDTDLLEEMGVETIWLRDFDQMAGFLQTIPGSTASGRVRSPRARSTVARRVPA